jgi:hypothetical protein
MLSTNNIIGEMLSTNTSIGEGARTFLTKDITRVNADLVSDQCENTRQPNRIWSRVGMHVETFANIRSWIA